MMKSTYKMLFRLYPADYRAVFGAEMLTTFEKAAADAGGPIRSIRFGVAEVVGLVMGAATEWMAKVAGRKLVQSQSSALDNTADTEKQIAIGKMVHAIANHDFPGARFYSNQERELRNRLARP